MDFAKNQLLKYGWKEGEGLGKNNDGISSALKPSLKFDKCGIGHDPAKEFTDHWWEEGYNNAVNNINVSNSEGDVKVSAEKCLEEVKKTSRKAKYESFLKTSTLTSQGYEEQTGTKQESITKPIKHVALTDEELLKACGKRTAHKGARHGLNLTGKLARIKAQEEELLMLFKNKNKSLETNSDSLSKVLKKKKRKHKSKE